MARLKQHVALVTGATRGVGLGIARALGAEGATVHVTGRTATPRAGDPLGGSLEETVAAIDAGGGRGVAHVCDHAVDDDVRGVARAIEAEHGRLDVLVNNVFAVPAELDRLFDTPFWEQPIHFWDRMHTVGLRSHYVATALTAPLLLASEGALVANVSSYGGRSYQVNVAYGVGKAGVDRFAADAAQDFRPHGVCVVSLYPGIVRTERVLAGQLPFPTEHAESPDFTGRAIAALALDEARMDKTGRTLVVAKLAEEYGFSDL